MRRPERGLAQLWRASPSEATSRVPHLPHTLAALSWGPGTCPLSPAGAGLRTPWAPCAWQVHRAHLLGEGEPARGLGPAAPVWLLPCPQPVACSECPAPSTPGQVGQVFGAPLPYRPPTCSSLSPCPLRSPSSCAASSQGRPPHPSLALSTSTCGLRGTRKSCHWDGPTWQCWARTGAGGSIEGQAVGTRRSPPFSLALTWGGDA